MYDIVYDFGDFIADMFVFILFCILPFYFLNFKAFLKLINTMFLFFFPGGNHKMFPSLLFQMHSKES